MENKDLKHWRIGSKSEFLGVEILPPSGRDIEYVVIDHIEFHNKYKVQGSDRDNVWLAFFKPNEYFDVKKPMILNSVNRKRICKQAKNQYPESISNFAVRLTQEETRDMSDPTEKTFGLRISKIMAKQPVKEKLDKSHQNWQKVIDYVKSGKPITDLYSKYQIDESVLKELQACLIPKANG